MQRLTFVSLALTVVFLAALNLHLAQGQIIAGACAATIGNNKYNLTLLAAQYLGQDATTTDTSQNVYYYRPCQALMNQNCQTGSDPTPAACQRDTRRPPQYHDCGTVSSALFSQRPNAGADQGFLLAFTGGQEDRQLDVEFICDKTAGTGTLISANPTEKPGLHYHLQWTTAFACPQTGGDGGDGGGDGGDGGGDGKPKKKKDDGPAISGGWIFIICLAGITILYFVLGSVLNKFVRHKEGIEIIPNVEFWMALPGLVKDGHLYVYRKLRGLCNRGGFEEV